MNSNGKILAAMAAGIAAGAVLGLLFAPDKGSETRRKISEAGENLADNVQAKFSNGREKIKDLREKVEHDVREKAEHLS